MKAPKLIVLNGPPAIGKSTVAEMYAAENSMTLNLDLDKLRDMISGWRDNPDLSAQSVKSMAARIAEGHLSLGYDVIIPQNFRRSEQLDAIKESAKKVGADYYEVLLISSRHDAVENYLSRRGIREGGLIDKGGGRKKLELMYDELMEAVDERAGTIRIDTSNMTTEEIYMLLKSRLREAPL